MGDHRAEIKISFWFHGKTYKEEMWINYFADDDGLDSRVAEFFRNAYEDGMARYHKQMQKLYEKEHAAEIEASERRELARLCEKYPDHSRSNQGDSP